MNYAQILADELGIRASQAQAVIDLIDAGNTIPFIARYRKEAHGSLDDTVLRSLAERLEYLRGLDKRREEILRSISDQDLLTDALKQKIESAKTLAELEDILSPVPPEAPHARDDCEGTRSRAACDVHSPSADARRRAFRGKEIPFRRASGR